MAGTLVAGDLIKSARDEHPTFDDRRHPDPVLLRELSRYQRELLAKIVAMDPTLAVEYVDTPLPLAVFENGIAIPAYKYPFGAQVTHVRDGRTHPVEIVSWESNTLYRHAVYLLNGILFLCGKAHDWEHFTNIRFLYVPEIAALAMQTTAVLTYLPNAAESTLVSYLAMKMAQRGGAADGEPKPDPGVFAAQWQLDEDRLFDELGRRTQAVSSVIRSVF